MSHITTIRGALAAATLAMGATLGLTAPAQADAYEPFIGELMTFGGNFCPANWARADGQLLAIANNDALFSLLGTIYGGDGRTTFGLPDLRGRMAFQQGSGPGLSAHQIGARGGANQVTLQTNNLAPHSHQVNSVQDEGTVGNPSGGYLAGAAGLPYHDGPPNAVMDPGVVGNAGGNVAVPLNPPLLGVTWCIALQGIYPSRS